MATGWCTLQHEGPAERRQRALVPEDGEEAQREGQESTTAYVWCLSTSAMWSPCGQGSLISRQARQGEDPYPGSKDQEQQLWGCEQEPGSQHGAALSVLGRMQKS